MRIENIEINWTGHSGFLIRENVVVYIDPFNLQSNRPKADIILITHPHYDHCSVKDIERVSKDGTIIVMPSGCQSKITKIDAKIDIRIAEPGQGIDLKDFGIKVLAVPAYNPAKQFHPKNEGWLGYVVKLGNLNVYHAGDTDLIPEMSKLSRKINIALLPVGGNYTMNAQEAAEAAFIIKPQIAIPMHYGSIVGTRQDAENFVKLCEEKGIKSEIL